MATYTVPQVPGSKRTSPRPYTHAVIGRRDLARERAHVTSTTFVELDRKNYDHHRHIVAVGVGGVWSRSRSGHGYVVTREMFDTATAAVSGCDTPEKYVAKLADFRLTSINRAGKGPAGQLEVLSWSMSAASAEKAAARHRRWFIDVRVVPCVAR